MSQNTCLKSVPIIPRVMDKGTIKTFTLLSFPIVGKAFYMPAAPIKRYGARIERLTIKSQALK